MIVFVLLLALALRLIAINQSLWLDEAINVNVARALDFKTLVLDYSLGDFHPPLYHILLKTWISLFGSSEIAVRIPSVLFGVGTVYLTYRIAKKLFEEKTAIIAAVLAATAPLSIYYSQEARMYSLAAFLCSLSVYFFISTVKKPTFPLLAGFITSTALTLYSEYLPYFLIPIYIIFLLLNRKNIPKAALKSFLPSFFLILILITPWLLIFPRQLGTGLSAAAASPAWAQVVGTPEVKSLLVTVVKFALGRISNDNNTIYALLVAPVALLFGFLFSLSFFRMSSLRSFLYYWLLGPLLLAYAASFFIPIFAYFRFLFVLPALYIILASAINTVNWNVTTRALLLAVLIINLIASGIYFTMPKFQREDWRAATRYIYQNKTPNTIVLFESNYTAAPFDYYNVKFAEGSQKLDGQGALSGFNADPEFIKTNLVKQTAGKDKVYLFQYLTEITDPQALVFQELTKNGFYNSSTQNFNGVGFLYEFKR